MKPASCLFVYGTLMSSAQGMLGQEERARLASESRVLGAAVLPGAQLYDLGSYPGLVESADETHIVHGEVIELHDLERTFHWLDEYEDVLVGDPERSLYARLKRNVRLAGGETVEAWVYVFLKDVSRHRRISSGRW